jgi:hypothetical protein
MKKIYSILLVLSFLFAVSCSSNSKKSEQENQTKNEEISSNETKIPFLEAKNYFVKNNYPEKEIHSLVLKTQKDFEEIFGMASTMGTEGKPTNIDFNKQYAIAIIGNTTDKATTIDVISLKKNNNEILLEYKINEGEKVSFKSRPFKLIIIDNSYDGAVKMQKSE